MALNTSFNAPGHQLFSFFSYLSSLFKFFLTLWIFKWELKISPQTSALGLYFNLFYCVKNKTEIRKKNAFLKITISHSGLFTGFPSPSKSFGHCWQEGAAADKWLVWCNMAVPMLPTDTVKKGPGILTLNKRILLIYKWIFILLPATQC